jgi:hypothetical protein
VGIEHMSRPQSGGEHLLVLERAQVRHLEAHLHHIAERFTHLDAVADLEGTTVRHDIAGDHVGDDGGGPE